MKGKKSILGLGLFALVLVLGVGYAVVSQVGLTISGQATVSESNIKVAFNDTTAVSNDKVTASAADNSLTGTINVTGLTLNESVTATYTIKNEETDVNAKITKTTIENNKSDYFQVTTDVDDTAKIVDAGGTTTVTVTVKLIKTPIETDDSTATISVSLKAEPTTESSSD